MVRNEADCTRNESCAFDDPCDGRYRGRGLFRNRAAFFSNTIANTHTLSSSMVVCKNNRVDAGVQGFRYRCSNGSLSSRSGLFSSFDPLPEAALSTSMPSHIEHLSNVLPHNATSKTPSSNCKHAQSNEQLYVDWPAHLLGSIRKRASTWKEEITFDDIWRTRYRLRDNAGAARPE